MLKRISFVAVLVAGLTVFATSAIAAKMKPAAYGYAQCKSKSKCYFNAITNPASTNVQLSFYDPTCALLAGTISDFGTLKLKSGKFSATKTETAPDPKDQQNHSMTIAVTGKLTKMKKVTATAVITSDSPSCTGLVGTKHLTMKYTGPIYGG